MTLFEEKYRATSNRFVLYLLAAHIPLLFVFAAVQQTSLAVALLGSLLLCAAPAVLTHLYPSHRMTSVSLGSATMGMSALLIYLGNGKIEYHFHIFSALAVLICLCSFWTMIAAAGTIALHHLLGWWLVPSAVFNYNAAFSDVVVHALFVVVETAICCRIVMQLAETVHTRGMLEEQVGRTADQVALGSAEIAKFVQTFANSAATQAGMVDQIASTSSTMRQAAHDSLSSAATAQLQMTETVKHVSQATRQLDSVNTDMQAAAADSRKISGIVTLMMDIARQTNILSVNASIEASRGGALGGGFGVIAEQVRELSRRTAEASQQIEEIIGKSVSRVETNSQSIQAISASFTNFHQATAQMKSMADQLQASGQQQAKDIELIDQSLQRISSETQHFAAGAEETASTSSELSRMAGVLRQSLHSIGKTG